MNGNDVFMEAEGLKLETPWFCGNKKHLKGWHGIVATVAHLILLPRVRISVALLTETRRD